MQRRAGLPRVPGAAGVLATDVADLLFFRIRCLFGLLFCALTRLLSLAFPPNPGLLFSNDYSLL